MKFRTVGPILVLVATFGCKDGSGSADNAAPAPAPTVAPAPAVAEPKPAPRGEGRSGHHRSVKGEKWIPAEYKKGMARFKDPGVYLDGRPVGMIKFGELPVPLKVAWYKERAAVEFKPGHKGPRFKIVKQRRYRFVDYFKGLGIDVKKIKEVHIYGGSKRAAAVVVSGANLRSKRDLTFRFGADVYGKPIPACPFKIGDGKCPDNIGAIAIYIDKKPPTRQGGYFYIDGKKIKGIPYYGEPLRGGIRVYLDGPLVATIKRRKLTGEDLKVKDAAGKVHWKFFGFLNKHGVDTDKVVEGWIIHKNRRVRRLGREDLENATFTASSQGKGEILFGDEKIRANSLSLHTRKVRKKDLPVIQPHEDET